MKFNHKSVKSILTGLLIGEGITVLCLLVAAFLMVKIGLPLYATDTVAIISAALGAFVAGFASAVIMKEKGIFYGAVCGVLMAVVMLVLAAFSSDLCGGMLTALKLAVVIGTAALGGIVGVNKKRKRVKF